MDAFGSINLAQEKGKKSLSCKSRDIRSLGVREFSALMEKEDIEGVIIQNLNSNKVENLFSTTPSVLLESRKIETDFELFTGDH